MPHLRYLVVDGLSIASSLQRSSEGCRASPESCTGDTEGVHDRCGGSIELYGFKQSRQLRPAVRANIPTRPNFGVTWSNAVMMHIQDCSMLPASDIGRALKRHLCF